MDFDLTKGVAVLERTPDVLRSMLAGLPREWRDGTEGPETWSPYVIVGHLIHGERTDWIPRARHILAEETRPFERFDREAQFRESRGKSLRELLETFARLRRESLDALEAMHLGEADLARTGNHPELGVVTLAQLLSTWTVHDLDHVAQIVRTMAKAYGAAVGPWTAYLSVLHDREG